MLMSIPKNIKIFVSISKNIPLFMNTHDLFEKNRTVNRAVGGELGRLMA